MLRRLEECSPSESSYSTRILVIDDDPQLHDLLEGFLAPKGYVLEHCLTGHEGLQRVADSPPDLIVLDLMMDAMDGFEIAATLQGNEATASLPIVVFTAKELEPSDRDRLRGRISALVIKQGSQHQLISVIEDLVARRRGG